MRGTRRVNSTTSPDVMIFPLSLLSHLFTPSSLLQERSNKKGPPYRGIHVQTSGKLDYRKTFGNTSLNGAGDTQLREPQPQPMSARDSAFTWMSLTKLPTAVAILQLVEQGRLSLDADVADQLPELAAQPVISSSSDGADTLVPRRAAITLRHLLSHTSGLQYPFIPGALAAYYERRARAGGEGFDMAKRRARVQERFGVPLVLRARAGLGRAAAGAHRRRVAGCIRQEERVGAAWGPGGRDAELLSQNYQQQQHQQQQ